MHTDKKKEKHVNLKGEMSGRATMKGSHTKNKKSKAIDKKKQRNINGKVMFKCQKKERKTVVGKRERCDCECKRKNNIKKFVNVINS